MASSSNYYTQKGRRRDRKVDKTDPDSVKTLIEKVRDWQDNVEGLKQKFLCLDCGQKPISGDKVPQHFHLCSDCWEHQEKPEECYYCQKQFAMLNEMKGWLRHTRVVMCVECIELKNEYGLPKNCEICKRQCAYKNDMCAICQEAMDDSYDDPVQCDMCSIECAFPGQGDSENIDGKDFCGVCVHKYKLEKMIKQAEKDSKKRKNPGLNIEPEDTSAQDYETYVQKKQALEDAEKKLKELTESLNDIGKRLPEVKDSEAVQYVVTKKKTLSKKQNQAEKLRLQIAQIEAKTTDCDKRLRVDLESDKRKVKTAVADLTSRKNKLAQDVLTLEQENNQLIKALHKKGKYAPWPWEKEEAEMAETKQRKSMEDAFAKDQKARAAMEARAGVSNGGSPPGGSPSSRRGPGDNPMHNAQARIIRNASPDASEADSDAEFNQQMEAIFEDEDQATASVNVETHASNENIRKGPINLDTDDDTDDEVYAPPSVESDAAGQQHDNQQVSQKVTVPARSPDVVMGEETQNQHSREEEIFEDAVSEEQLSRAASHEQQQVDQNAVQQRDIVDEQHQNVENTAQIVGAHGKKDEIEEFDPETDDSDVERLPDSPVAPEQSLAPVRPHPSPRPSPRPSPMASPDGEDEDDYLNDVLADQEVQHYQDDELYGDEEEDQLLDEYEGREGIDYGQEAAE